MTLLSRYKRPAGRKTIESEPYSVLAGYYDRVMSHVFYREWAYYVLEAAQRDGITVRTITDLACGTGIMAAYFADWGYRVAGFDGSQRMIREARARQADPQRELFLQVADLRKTPPVEPQDLVLCLYDSINYLVEEEDLEAFFASTRPVVKDEGRLIFDCSTESNSLRHFDGYRDSEEIDGALVYRHAYYDLETRTQNNVFEIFPPDEEVMYREHHRQRIWSIELLAGKLAAAGFELRGIYDGTTFRPGGEDSDRVHFLAKPS